MASRTFANGACSAIERLKEEAVDTFNDEDKTTPFISDHALLSKEEGDSEIELVTRTIEKRWEERVTITFNVRVALMEYCREIALQKNYEVKSKIPLSDLLEYRDRVHKEHEKQRKKCIYNVMSSLGVWSQNEQLVRVLDRAVELVEAQGVDDRYFEYMDFDANYTRVSSRWPWQRNDITRAMVIVFLFYFATPIFFCPIVGDPNICPAEPDTWFPGWTTSLYFASTTLSTVGYGDLTVNRDNSWNVFAGILYMIGANVTLIASFSVCIDSIGNPLSKYYEQLVNWVLGEQSLEEPVHKKVQRLLTFRLTELIGQFVILNLVGVFANRLFLLSADTENLTTDWTWIISVYWAVQTTTTIGYGDLDQPVNQAFFNIFYLMFSTYFVGSALGQLAGLRSEMIQIRRKYAWERRETSKNLIGELKREGHDGKIGQYEFLVVSLVQLGKLSSEDVVPIMDKFRSLAGDSGYITATTETEATDQVVEV